jgi:small subunit ribosomal protein S1
MEMEEGSEWEGGEAPAPMDESWWAAVLQDEGRHRAVERPKVSSPMGEKNEVHGSPEDWAWAKELYEEDDTIELSVIGYNRGGLLVEARSLRGFIPVSHLVAVQPLSDDDARSEQLSTLVGQNLWLKVIEYDHERGRLVFSERAALAGPGTRAELLASLQQGHHVKGMVTNITRFGVFVDLGGVEGLIHVSELSWGRVRHPADVVSFGQELDVQVLSIDRDQGRVALSLKELLPDPWATVEDRFQIDEIVVGTVTNVVKFGAFVGIEDGLEGLIHVSELGDGNLLHPRNVLCEGEQVRVRIIHINAEERRLGLSLRQVPQSEEEGTEASTTSEHPEAPISF